MALDARLTATVVAAEDLQAAFEHVEERRAGTPLIQILHGHRAADSTVVQLMGAASSSLLSMQPGPTTEVRHEVNPWDLDALERGVRLQTMYSSAFLAEEGAMEMVRALVAAGEEARVHNGLPTVMLHFDDETVLLPTDRDGHPSQGAAVIRSSSVVHVCKALFERYWEESIPLDLVAPRADPVPDLLLAGFSDDRIARELDVSVRTVRRRIRDLMARHGAATRVQLGAALARRAGQPPSRADHDRAGPAAADPGQGPVVDASRSTTPWAAG